MRCASILTQNCARRSSVVCRQRWQNIKFQAKGHGHGQEFMDYAHHAEIATHSRFDFKAKLHVQG